MARKVKSTGPTPCSILLIAERPGKVEDRRGYCLCGPSGQELDRYLFANAGISRDNVHCMNLVDTYSEDPPTQEEIDANWDSIENEITAVNPDYVILMGLYAARAGIGDHIDMEWANGLMFPSDKRSCLCMPIIHVAAGLHQPRYAAQIAWAFTQFGRMIRGEDMPMGHLEDNYPDPTYAECHSIINTDGPIAVDTEGSSESPWCVSASRTPGTGCVHRYRNVKLAGTVIGHNMIHDLQVLEALGIKVSKFTDTMTMAALMGTEPLGLKSLARRHCGMEMQEYSDVIAPAKREKALEYLGKVLDLADTHA